MKPSDHHERASSSSMRLPPEGWCEPDALLQRASAESTRRREGARTRAKAEVDARRCDKAGANLRRSHEWTRQTFVTSRGTVPRSLHPITWDSCGKGRRPPTRRGFSRPTKTNAGHLVRQPRTWAHQTQSEGGTTSKKTTHPGSYICRPIPLLRSRLGFVLDLCRGCGVILEVLHKGAHIQ